MTARNVGTTDRINQSEGAELLLLANGRAEIRHEI